MILPPPRSQPTLLLFPYPTLFRSRGRCGWASRRPAVGDRRRVRCQKRRTAFSSSRRRTPAVAVEPGPRERLVEPLPSVAKVDAVAQALGPADAVDLLGL